MALIIIGLLAVFFIWFVSNLSKEIGSSQALMQSTPPEVTEELQTIIRGGALVAEHGNKIATLVLLPFADCAAVDTFNKFCGRLAAEQGREFIDVQRQWAGKCKLAPKATLADLQKAWHAGG